MVVKGKVIVGISGPGEMGPRGFVEAFDAETGKSVWRWYSIPAAGEPGSETWQADTWKIGGGAVWHTGTYDPATNLLYVGDRKSTRLNSSHGYISYAVFCLKKKKKHRH